MVREEATLQSEEKETINHVKLKCNAAAAAVEIPSWVPGAK